MPMQKFNVEQRVGRECKIRKRGSHSSSSSSVVHNYRLKRAILVGKRGGGSRTPVPIWKMGSVSPPIACRNAKPMNYPPSKDLSVSARKLAATLWEINEVASPKVDENWEVRSRERVGRASKSSSVLPHSCEPIHSPAAERMDRSKAGEHRRRTAATPQNGVLESIHNGSIVEIETQSRGRTSSGYVVGDKTRLKDVSNGLTASKELLKVLNRIWVQEEQRSSSLSVVSALRFELDRARLGVDQFIQEQQSNRHEIDHLLKKFAEEKASWKIKEGERIRNAISSVSGELDIEKRLRRQTERINKKLAKELAETKESLSKALKELQSEKRTREILEQVCDELATGIGNDRAEVEEIKRESAKVKEEMEKEREMLHLADVLREERVQMKLSEAKYQFEEKNSAVDQLKNELESYLRTKVGEEVFDNSPNLDRIKELEEYLRNTLGASCQNGERGKDEGEVVNGKEHEGDDSGDSDLHSIELNVDNNSKIYNWSYGYSGGGRQNDSKRSSVDEKSEGRRSVSEKNRRNNVCLERADSIIEEEIGAKGLEKWSGFDRGRLLGLVSQAWRKDHEDEIERYDMVRDLRESILSGTRKSSSQDPASVVVLEGLELKAKASAQPV